MKRKILKEKYYFLSITLTLSKIFEDLRKALFGWFDELVYE